MLFEPGDLRRRRGEKVRELAAEYETAKDKAASLMAEWERAALELERGYARRGWSPCVSGAAVARVRHVCVGCWRSRSSSVMQSAAGACSCMPGDKPVMSTFVGRVESVSGDAFSFVDVVTEAGPKVPGRVLVIIRAARPVNAAGHQEFTSCDVAGDQPAVGGVYRVTVDPAVPGVNDCGGSFSLVEAPPPPDPRVRQAVAAAVDAPAAVPVAAPDDDDYRPTVPIVLGAMLLAIGGGFAISRRRGSPALTISAWTAPGPCTPTVSVISMSALREDPVIITIWLGGPSGHQRSRLRSTSAGVSTMSASSMTKSARGASRLSARPPLASLVDDHTARLRNGSSGVDDGHVRVGGGGTPHDGPPQRVGETVEARLRAGDDRRVAGTTRRRRRAGCVR